MATNRWNYASDGGINYPVSSGDTWKVGNHTFYCSDLENTQSHWQAKWRSHPIKLIYCDPPWGSGVARAYRTKAQVDGAVGKEVNAIMLYKSILQVAAENKILAFAEMSLKDEPLLVSAAEALGGTVVKRWNITYYGNKPCALYLFNFGFSQPFTTPNLEGKDDDFTPEIVFKHYLDTGLLNKGDLIGDPCAGRGLISVSAEKHGLASVNNELHPNRISSSLTKLSKLTKQEPRRA